MTLLIGTCRLHIEYRFLLKLSYYIPPKRSENILSKLHPLYYRLWYEFLGSPSTTNIARNSKLQKTKNQQQKYK